MANFFDRFDPPSTKGKPNYFDRFDEPKRENRKGHDAPAFDPGVPGYNAETGTVEQTGMADKVGAFSASGVEGVPIAGPALLSGAKALAAGAVAPFSDQDFGEIYDHMGRRVQQVQADNPNTATAGHVTGAVAGTLPMIRAVPAAFGGGPGGIVGRSVKSALGGIGIGGTDAAVRGKNPWNGALAGGVAGVAGPILGAALGAGYRGVSEFMANRGVGDLGRKGVELLRRTMQADGITAEQAGEKLAKLGPGAMLADVGPNTQQLAAGLVAIPGEGRGIVQNAIRGRDAAANSRLTGTMDDTLGPAPIPSRLDAGITEGQRALGPSYDAVLANAKPVDLDRIAIRVDANIFNSKGAAQSAMEKVRDMLNRNGSDVLDTNPGTLLQTRHAVDGMLDEAKDTNVLRVLKSVRKEIDDELTSKVPGIKEVDAQYAELARQREALGQGQQIFNGDRASVVRPQELAQQVQEGALPQGLQIGPSAVPVRLREGARAELDRIVGTSANDRVALQRLVKGEGDWNPQKLATLFGQEKADKILDVLDAERVFAETSQFVTRNSATAARQEAADMIKGGSGPGMREAFTYGGTPGVARSAALGGFDKLTKALMEGSDLSGLARIVVSPEHQRIVEALAKIKLGPTIVPAAIADVSRAALLGPATALSGR
ncbi:MAG: hypothetical protein AB7P20_11445 [Rhizobiaceae bacterium]